MTVTLTIFTKRFMIDARLGSKYASGIFLTFEGKLNIKKASLT